MKSTPTHCLLLGLLLMAQLTTTGFAEEDTGVKLLDMFAKAEGDVYKIYIMASGDISEYKTSRELRPDSYKLILDVPALPPTDTKYDLTTPFSRRFEVWPMKLGDQVFCRITMELDLEASSVIGQSGPARIFITISRKSETAVVDSLQDPSKGRGTETVPIAIEPVPTNASSPSDPLPSPNEIEPQVEAPETPSPEEPPLDIEPIPMETDPEPDVPEEITNSDEPDEQTTAEPTADSADGSLFAANQSDREFFSLFPIPVTEPRIAMDLNIDEPGGIHFDGIRLGRFLMRPAIYAGYMRGSNVLLLSDDEFRDSVVQFRSRTTFDLLESENALRLTYELRYQEYGKFELIDNFSHFFDFETNIHVTPTMLVEIQNHLVKGSYESREYDPGAEVAFSFDPFLRNLTRAALNKDMSERMGFEIYGSYHHVHFLEKARFFYDYDTTITGASFLYHLSPLTSLFGSYEHIRTPQPAARPQAQSSGDSLYMGLKGEISPLLVGRMRAGFRDQEFGEEGNRLSYRGLVADVSLTRYFGELTALEARVGRMTSPSNFEENGYFLSNYLHARFAVPLTRNFRLNTGISLFDNNYPLPSAEIGGPREDRATTGWLGGAYYFTRRTYFEVNFRHERRNSNLDQYSYRNNVIMFLVGFGYL